MANRKNDVSKKPAVKRTLTDETIDEIYGEKEKKQKEEDNKRVATSVIMNKKLRELARKAAKEESMTYNAYVISLIKLDLRRKGYLES